MFIHRVSARRAYLTLDVVAGIASTMAFTITSLYRIRTAGLEPHQLVLVGTAMELSVLVGEIPTGVVADVVSRRASIVVGHLGMGLALVFESQVASFWPILAAQAFWGLSYTFTSGATAAWLSGEVGDEEYGDVSLLASQIGAPLEIVGVVVGFSLAAVDLSVPILIGGCLSVVLAMWLAVSMPEQFQPTPREERTTWGAFTHTARTGVGLVRRTRVLLVLTVALAFAGGSTEAFDRLWEFHVLDQVGLPSAVDGSPVFWFGAISAVSGVLGFFATRWVRRQRLTRDRARAERWIIGLLLGEATIMVLFGFSGAFWVAALLLLAYDRVRRLRNRLLGAWIVPLAPKDVRATVLSTMEQGDSVGQAVVGPLLGALATGSTTVAMAVGATLLLPSVSAVLMARAPGAGRAPAHPGCSAARSPYPP